jgi:hypothetical protein
VGRFGRFGRERGTVGVRVGCAICVEEGLSFGFSGGLAIVEGSDERVVEREIFDVRVVGRTGKLPVAPRVFIEVAEYKDNEVVEACIGDLLIEERFESFGLFRRRCCVRDTVDGYDTQCGAVRAKKSDGGKASIWVTIGMFMRDASVPQKSDA